jgi:hypothetical protein
MILLSGTLAFAAEQAVVEHPTGEHVHRFVRIGIAGRADVDALADLRIALVNVQPDFVTAEVVDSEIAQVRRLGLPIEILYQDARDAVGTDLEYHTYDSMVAELNQILADHPAITRLISLGKSVQNRDIWAMRVTDNPTVEEAEGEIQILGNMHGNEKIGTEVSMYALNYLTNNYPSNPQVRNLVDNREIWFVPMPNPDGTTRNSRENVNGIDLNRDFGYMWDHWGRSPSAFSQVEVKAVRNLVEANNLSISIDYHSGTEYVIYPWGFFPDLTRDDDYFEYMCDPYGSWAGYPVGPIYREMYEVHGSSCDYEYGSHGTMGFCVELSYSYAPPASQIEGICQANLNGVLNCIDLAGRGLQGRITDVSTGDPVRAMVNVVEIDWPVYTDPVVGDYHRPLLTGTYTVRVSASGYQTQTISNVNVDQNTVTTLDVQLVPGGPNTIYKVNSCDNGNSSWDRQNHTVTPAALGLPDGVYNSIGVGGWIVYDMGQGTELVNGTGKDFTVYEGGNTLENFTLYASNSWEGPWNTVGTGRGTTQFDLATSGLSSARYVKIQDDGDGTSSESYPGFDMDALVNTAPQLVTVTLVPDGTTLHRGETLGFTATVRNNSDLTSTYEVWTEARLPGGGPYPGNPVIGPTAITLGPHRTLVQHLTHVIPMNAPYGTYTYTGLAGGYDSSVLGQGSFDFTVVR